MNRRTLRERESSLQPRVPQQRMSLGAIDTIGHLPQRTEPVLQRTAVMRTQRGSLQTMPQQRVRQQKPHIHRNPATARVTEQQALRHGTLQPHHHQRIGSHPAIAYHVANRQPTIAGHHSWRHQQSEDDHPRRSPHHGTYNGQVPRRTIEQERQAREGGSADSREPQAGTPLPVTDNRPTTSGERPAASHRTRSSGFFCHGPDARNRRQPRNGC